MGKQNLLDRFIKYVKIDTQANRKSNDIPSSKGQIELAKIVEQDFIEAGVQNTKINDKGILFGTIPSNIQKDNTNKVPTIGFLSHFDTAAECLGKNVNPQIIENYDGKEITYPNNKNLVLSCKEDERLAKSIGHTIITTDGTTLLGSDDKSGIATIVEAATYINKHPEIIHGDLRIAIIPDEELGAGAERLDIKEFAADFAYTIDGSGTGEIDTESFNGYMGKVEVIGRGFFPGYGKGRYLNAIKVLSEFISMMDESLWPENCEARDGIWWVDDIKGGTSKAETLVYLRDFDLAGIKDQKIKLEDIKNKLLKKYNGAKINIDICETYKNYKTELDKDRRVVEYAKEATKRAGIECIETFVRGGNDASHLCFAGLLATNLSTGFVNMHSLKEWVSLEAMQKASKVIVNLAQVWVEKTK